MCRQNYRLGHHQAAGPVKWTYYYLYLYVILDIFSRYVTGWMVATCESAALAEKLISGTCAKQQISPGQLAVHADRGSSMTSKPVAFLLADLSITQSHSRPHVSNDNPGSESQFKPFKYRPAFPGQFASIPACPGALPGLLPLVQQPALARCLIQVDRFRRATRGRSVKSSQGAIPGWRAQVTGNLIMPQFIEIETSRQCNRRCAWCPNGQFTSRSQQELMHWGIFTKLIHELAELGYCGEIALHNYNEPLLNPRIYREIETIKASMTQCSVTLFTNGDYLTRSTVKRLAECGVSLLRITLYPATIDDSQPSIQRIQRWLRIKALDDLEWVNGPCKMGLCATSTYDRMNLLVISPDLLTYNYRGGTAETLADYTRTVPCHLTTRSAAIDYLGRMKMCCNVFPESGQHDRYIVGTLDSSSFAALWSSGMMNSLRKAHARADWSGSPICERCVAFTN
jgi:hypothetical protein